MKRKIAVLFCLISLCIITVLTVSNKLNSDNNTETPDNNVNTSDKNNPEFGQTQAPTTTNDTTIHTNVEIDTTPDSYTVLVNKEYGLPSDYIPDDLVVPNVRFSFSYYDEKKQLRKVPAEALEELFTAAQSEGLIIKGVSGYRSYKRQQTLYNNYLRTQGVEHTEKYSAKPGYSEHQSGLSIDVSSASAGNDLTEAFGNTAEGQWLAENCYKYGFIIRYPEGKESITGYAYEPWHIRYVGTELATYLTKNDLTLEEYYNYTPSATIAPEESTNDYDLETVPTITPKPYSYTSKPVRTKTPTESPKATEEATATPKVTETPKPTKTPTATKTPKPTSASTKKPTSTPKATKEPVKTEKPVATKAPVTQPAKTHTPAATKTPTKKPESTASAEIEGTGSDSESSIEE